MNTRNAILAAIMLMVFFVALRTIFLREEPRRPYISLTQLEHYECLAEGQIMLTYQMEAYVPQGATYERMTALDQDNATQEEEAQDMLVALESQELAKQLDEQGKYWIEQRVDPVEAGTADESDYLYVEFDCTNVLEGNRATVRIVNTEENR